MSYPPVGSRGALNPNCPSEFVSGWCRADRFLLADGMTDLVPCLNVEDYRPVSCQLRACLKVAPFGEASRNMTGF